MPKWTEYTTKDTLADNDEVMLYDATGKANKRGLMSKFWDYVVDKMSTAVISKLETNNKTIIGAINALNSETIIHNRKDGKNIAHEESITVPVTVKESGWYLIMFSVCHCGADNSDIKSGACWNVSGTSVDITARERLNIPISKSWDNSNSVCIFSKIYEGNIDYKFTNNTGVATNAEYASTFDVLAIKV